MAIAENWQQLQDLFHSAIALTPNQRAPYLERTCHGDNLLRKSVESLIQSHEESCHFIDSPAFEAAAEMLADGHEFKRGQTLGHYEIHSLLGSGGMGEVYLAQDTRLNRKIALKLLPPHFTINPDRVRRFEREARAASALNHPNIVTIYEIGQSNSAHFIATEFVDGKTVRQLINEKPFTLSETLNVAIQVAGALTGAHAAGIVHRDIKPENIMVRADGYVKILDFGLAKLTELQTTESDLETPTLLQSNPGLVMGTVQYMSPEQARGKKVDVRADIWSLGVVLYELLAGRVPFSGDTPSHVMVSLMEDELPPLTSYANVPPELDRIISKALRKNQKERYQTANQLAHDLKNLKRELEVEARLKGSLEAIPSSKERTTTSAGQTRAQASSLATAFATDTVALQSGETGAHLTSSAEYLVSEIKRHKRGFLIAAATLTIAVVAVGYFYFAARSRFAASSEVIDSVAVLPFVNVSNDPNTEYLSDGLSDSIIDSLSQLPNLKKVSAFNSVLRYKGKQVDPQAVGRELNVRAVLTGRLVQRGDDLLIIAELVDVKDNKRLWGGQYNRKSADILNLQGEIAREISEKLRPKLTGEERKRLNKRQTENAEAYQLYLQGRYYWHKFTDEALIKSGEYFQRAIEKDPNYALAYAGLSDYYAVMAFYGQMPPKEALRKSEEAAVKALTIDDALGEAHFSLAVVKAWYDWDWPGGEREFKRAIELNPEFADAESHSMYAFLLDGMGRFDEAIAEAKRSHWLVGRILYHAR